MVSELFTNATQGMAWLYGVSPANAVILFAFLFSVMFAIIGGVKTGKPIVGAVIFFLSLFVFAILDAFPLWIVALPLIIIVMVAGATQGGND